MDNPSDPGGAACGSIEDVMSVLGRAWAGAVIEAMLDGRDRYTDIAAAVPGATPSVLSTRLKDLCARGIAERVTSPGPPSSVTYRLTDAGRDVAPILQAIRAFAAAHPDVARRP